MIIFSWQRPFPSLFGGDRWLPIRPLSIRMPSLDVYEEKDSVVVKAEFPGMKKEDVEVNLAGEALTIKGEKKEDKEVKRTTTIAVSGPMGRSYGLSPCLAK